MIASTAPIPPDACPLGTGPAHIAPSDTDSHPNNAQKKKREPRFAPKRDLAEDVERITRPAQNECRIPIRTSACVCVVDGVKL